MNAAVLRPEADVELAPFSTLGVGGRAQWFARAESPEQVEAAHAWCRERALPLTVLGGGSNLVISDSGVRGLVLLNQLRGVVFDRRSEETRVNAGAGEWWDQLVSACVARDLVGVECLSGIPGSVGGTPIQNVGAYGQEVGDTIETVTAFDRDRACMQELPVAECRLTYRSSRFKAEDVGRWIVCAVTFRLRTGEPTVSYPDIRAHLDRHRTSEPRTTDVRDAVLAVRRAKGMVIDPTDPDTRSVGSFFVNPILVEAERERIASVAGERVPGYPQPDGRVKVPAAWLIERAGFHRGLVDGLAGISSKHTLALVNRGGATAADIIRLAGRITRAVADRFDVCLHPEPVFLGFESDPWLDALRRDAR